jgi:hypothetical protein
MILIFILSLLGDDNTLYLMDKSFSLVPIEEELQFIYSKNGIQTTQGCMDLERWYQLYRTKIWMPLFSKLVLEYHLYKENDYDIDIEEHLFRLRWIPEEKDKNPLSFSLFISPTHLKNRAYAGIGIGYWKNTKNNHSFNIIINEFDHNFLLSHKGTLIYEDPFTRFPLSTELKGNISNSQADLYYRYYKTIPGKKNFFEDDAQTGRGEYGGMGLTNIVYYHLFERISPGLRLNYSQTDSSYTSLLEDSLSYETNSENFFSEPFIKTKISDKSTFYIGLPMNWKYIKNDSLEYKRKWIGVTSLYNHSIFDYVDFTVGLQKSWRNLNGEKNSETRAVIGLEFNFNERTNFIIRQAIELDSPLPKKLSEYNNHAYLMFTYCF